MPDPLIALMPLPCDAGTRDLSRNYKEATPGKRVRKHIFSDTRDARPGRHEDRCAESDVVYRQVVEGSAEFCSHMPVRTVVCAGADASALVAPQQTCAIEHADGETGAGDSHDFLQGARPVFYETQCGHGHYAVEARVNKWQGTRISLQIVRPRVTTARVGEPFGIWIDAGHAQFRQDRKTPGEPAGAAAHIKHALPGLGVEQMAQ